jgi:AAA domain-containing protein
MAGTCASCGTGHDVDWIRSMKANLCTACFEDESVTAETIAAGTPPKDGKGPDRDHSDSSRNPVRLVTVHDFTAVDEPGADPIVGEEGEVLIPENGDVMFYGDGGASKTTLAIDLAVHLAAGDDWLGARISRPVRVALVEAEGPRPLFRRKLRHKLDGWQGGAIGDRLQVLESPWGEFRFPDGDEVAERLGELEVDVLIVGPLTRVGWEELGTLQQVRDFTAVIAAFRKRTGRPLTVVLIHHENKGGTVSGAWEGAGDTLLHAQVRARGKTTLTVQKARWSGEWHKRTLELRWTDGEGFEVIEEPDRDLITEIKAWLIERPEHYHSTAKEIATEKRIERADGTVEKLKGIGAKQNEVRDALEDRQDLFRVRTGEQAKAVGRRANARVWDVKEGPGDEADEGDLFDA